MMSFYTRALLRFFIVRPPCWNKHGAARTTRHDSTWLNKWNLGLTTLRRCKIVYL